MSFCHLRMSYGNAYCDNGHLRYRRVGSLVVADEEVQLKERSIAGVARDEVEGFRRAIDRVHVRDRQASWDVFAVCVSEIFVADVAFSESVGLVIRDQLLDDVGLRVCLALSNHIDVLDRATGIALLCVDIRRRSPGHERQPSASMAARLLLC